jgi:uncharacterized protein (DUF2062 family)
MNSWLRKQTLKLYRTLRSPQARRGGRFRAWLARVITDRELWRPQPLSMCRGMGLGLFIAIQPFPMQMLLGILLAIRWRANIPSVMVCCLLTTPATWAITFIPSAALGGWLLHSLGFLPEWAGLAGLNMARIWEQSLDVIVALLVGCLLVGLIAGGLGYLITWVWYRCASQMTK